jgi:hypothetical protein
MLYFSCVVFTTLGFGDELPKGPLRSIANFEALLGAIWLSLITVAVARQIIRR